MGHLRNPLVNSPNLHRCGAPARAPPLKPCAPPRALLHPTQGSCYLKHPCDHKKNKQLSRTGQKASFPFKAASGHPPLSSWGPTSPFLIVCQQNKQLVKAQWPRSPVPRDRGHCKISVCQSQPSQNTLGSLLPPWAAFAALVTVPCWTDSGNQSQTPHLLAFKTVPNGNAIFRGAVNGWSGPAFHLAVDCVTAFEPSTLLDVPAGWESRGLRKGEHGHMHTGKGVRTGEDIASVRYRTAPAKSLCFRSVQCTPACSTCTTKRETPRLGQ